MATTHPATPKETPPGPAPAPTVEITPREGTEPAADRVPHHGGGFALVGGAYSGGCVQEEAPPEPEVETAKKKV